MIDAPCRDCKDRAVGCHAKCERYMEWLRIRQEEKNAILANKAKDIAYAEYVSISSERFKKKNRRQGRK